MAVQATADVYAKPRMHGLPSVPVVAGCLRVALLGARALRSFMSLSGVQMSAFQFRLALVALAPVLAAGCALQAPPYHPSLDNVDLLKKIAGPTALGSFTVQAGGAGVVSIGLRGSSMNSTVGADYAAYLANALSQELQLAGKLDPKSKVVIAGLLLKNDIAAGGLSTNSGEIEAQFTVINDGQERYRGTQRAEMSWDSSLMGAIAIPKAQQQYPLLVQKLLARLMADTRFQAALK
jgi:hypothetical protein